MHKVQIAVIKRRAFWVIAPHLWNALPPETHMASSIVQVRHLVKIEFFIRWAFKESLAHA